MKRTTRGALLVALSSTVALTAAACGGGSDNGGTGGGSTAGSTGGSTAGSTGAQGPTSSEKGGTLYYLTQRNAEHLDPQRTYIGRDIGNEARMVYRTLTTFPVASGDASTKVVPDLATDTGTSSNGAKTWKFTIKDGVKWQDGSPITCKDFQYGISRTFATDVITGGPNYAIQFLDIPTAKDGSSVYKGPYAKDSKGQALFDKAVQCTGNTITFHLKKAVADFNSALYLPAFAPYKKSQDQGDKSNFDVFSSGPYKLQGKWNSGGTSTFVRNPNWDPKTDKVRHALPDKIVFTEGLTNEIIAQRLIADNGNDKYAVSDRSVPPSFQAQIAGNPKAKERATNPASPFVDYLVTNFGSKTMQNPKVREALAVSTDKGAYITAQGGPTMGTPATSMINPNTPGYKKYNAFGAPDNGDPAKAKQLLKEAGVSTPVKINYIYSGGTPTSDKAAAALKEGWEKAGFKVSLQPETQNYYTIIQNPAKQSTWDVAWGGWGQDWPGAATVIPPLWDSRVNLTKSSNAQDYGQYKSDKVNKAIDAAYKLTDPDKQNAAWGDIDEMIQKDGGYVPLSVEKFFLIHGSGVTNWIDNPAFADYPDLGSLGIQQ